MKKETETKPVAKSKTPLASDDLIRVNALVTQAEHQKIKVYAAQHQTTISELFRNLIKNLPD